MAGEGFKLAVVETLSPRDRESVVAWVRGLCGELGARLVTLDLASLRGENLWAEMRERLGDLPHKAVLVLSGLETTERREGRPGLLGQLNVQRDILVRDFPVVWILLSHPSLRLQTLTKAPDFSDYVARWVEAVPPMTLEARRAANHEGPTAVPPLPLSGPASEEREILEGGWAALGRWNLDVARDALSRLGLRNLDEETASGRTILEGWLLLRTENATHADEVFRTVVNEGGPLGDVARLGRAQALHVQGRLKETRLLLAETFPEGEWGLVAEIHRMDVTEDAGGDTLTALLRRVTDPVPLRMELLQRWAGRLTELGEWDAALEVLHGDVIAWSERVGDAHLRADAVTHVALLLERQGNLTEALRLRREEVAPVLEGLGDTLGQAMNLRGEARIFAEQGQQDRASAILQDRVLPVVTGAGHQGARAVSLADQTFILSRQGRNDDALHIYQHEVLPVLREIGDTRNLAVALGNLAGFLTRLGRPEEAHRILTNEVLPVVRALGDPRDRALILAQVGGTWASLDRHQEALHLLENEVLPVLVRLGAEADQARCHSNIARSLFHLHDLPGAWRHLARGAIPLFERLGLDADLATARYNLARVLLARGSTRDRIQASRELRQARDLAESLNLPLATEIRDLQRKRGWSD